MFYSEQCKGLHLNAQKGFNKSKLKHFGCFLKILLKT